jgi:hypothetical protein
MKYKLTEMTIDLRSGTVACRCQFAVQNTAYQIDFTLAESDLYGAAADEARDSWENDDVVSVAKAKLGIDVEL